MTPFLALSTLLTDVAVIIHKYPVNSLELVVFQLFPGSEDPAFNAGGVLSVVVAYLISITLSNAHFPYNTGVEKGSHKPSIFFLVAIYTYGADAEIDIGIVDHP